MGGKLGDQEAVDYQSSEELKSINEVCLKGESPDDKP